MQAEGARETSYATTRAGEVSALLVPARTLPPHAGIVFLHWGFGDRTSFADEADAYAACGATSLSIDAPGFGARKGVRIPHADPASVRAYGERLLGDLAGAVDQLCAHAGVEATRIGFVGHSLGATIAGAFLAGERRVRAAALLTGHPELSRVWLARGSAEGARSLEELDGVRTIGRAHASVFFQFAERDEWIPTADAERYVAAADASRREALWYAADHALEGDRRALRDRARWLCERLSLAPVSVEALARVALPRAQVWKYRAVKPVLALANRFARPVSGGPSA